LLSVDASSDEAQYALWGCDPFGFGEPCHRPRKRLGRRLPFTAITNYGSTLAASGGVKKTTKQLAALEFTAIKAKLKHAKQLNDKRRPHVKLKLAATDEFGQIATDEVRVELCSRSRTVKSCEK
jgi:hypothetical protein